MEPKCEGKVSVIGERELGSMVTVERTARPTPPMPNPLPSCSSSSSGIGVGGVGVRGGAGIGNLDAMAWSLSSSRYHEQFKGGSGPRLRRRFAATGANIRSDCANLLWHAKIS